MAQTAKISILLGFFLIYANCNIQRLSSIIFADFNIVLDNLIDSGPLLESFDLKTKRQCVLECVSLVSCKSVNFHKESGRCELVGRSLEEGKTKLTSKAGWVYMTTNDEELNIGPTCKLLSPCLNNAICRESEENPKYQCFCKPLYAGKHCQKRIVWATGDGKGDTEDNTGAASSKKECYDRCSSRRKDGQLATGVTVDKETETKCYCEYGMTGRNTNEKWLSAFILNDD